MNPFGLLFVAMGVFAVSGAVFNWDWYMNHRKARFLTWLLGRGGARIVYVLLGVGLIVLGVLMALGIIKEKR